MVSLQKTQENRDTLISTNYITELLIKLAKTQPSKTIGGHQLYRGSMLPQEALRDTLQQDSEVLETKRECQQVTIGGKGDNSSLPKEKQSIQFGGADVY